MAASVQQWFPFSLSPAVDEVIERGSCDLVTDLAGEMPSFVIAEIGVNHDGSVERAVSLVEAAAALRRPCIGRCGRASVFPPPPALSGI